MKVNLDFKLKEDQNPDKTIPQEILFNWLTYGVSKSNLDGLKGGALRTWNRVVRKFEDAIDAKSEEIEFEESEKDIIRQGFSDNVSFPLNAAKIVCAVQNEIASWSAK